MKTLLINLLLTLLKKEVHTMAVVYATLIIKDLRTFSSVPARIKEQVREVLIALDLEELTRE